MVRKVVFLGLRPCTGDMLTPAGPPTVGTRTAEFVVVGGCVHAVPRNKRKKILVQVK